MSRSQYSAACAAAVGGVALSASAFALTQIEGAGSTLIGPPLRQIEDCYGNPVALVYQGTATIPPPYYPPGSETYSGSALNVPPGSPAPPAISFYDYLGTPAFNCTVQHIDLTVQLNYVNAGSGNGQLYAMTHVEPTDVGTTTEPAAPAGTVAFGGGQYGMSDFGVGAADVAAYTSGGALTQKDAGGNVVVVPAPGNAPLYGAFIQFPIAVAPIAIAYPPVYGATTSLARVTTWLSLRVKKPNKDGSGGLLLDIPTACAIFNGQITDLADPALTALNGGTQLADLNDPNKGAGWTAPFQLVGQADASGATSILYRALAAQCGQGPIHYGEGGDNINYVNAYLPAGGKRLPAALIGPGRGQFITETGQSRVADQLGKAIAPPPPGTTVYQAQMGYLGTPYVLPGVLRDGENTYGLHVADLIPVGAAVGLEPTALNALTAFGSGAAEILPPQSDASGNYTLKPPPNSIGLRVNPQDWAEPIADNALLADPDGNLHIHTAYPIVGTTNAYLNTCYAAAVETAKVVAFLDYLETAKLVTDVSGLHPGVLAAAGLSPLPRAWTTAIVDTFVKPVKIGLHATAQLNLNILQAGGGPPVGVGSQCHAVAPGA